MLIERRAEEIKNKKIERKKAYKWIALSVAVSIVGILLSLFVYYGFWTGRKVSLFATYSNAVLDKTAGWEADLSKNDLLKLSETAIKIQTEARKEYYRLEKMSVPSRSEALKKQMLAYLGDVIKNAEEIGRVSSWYLKLQSSVKGLDKIAIDSNTLTGLVESLDREKANMLLNKSEIESMEAPEGFEDEKDDFIKLYQDTVDMYDKIIVASSNGDIMALTVALSAGTDIYENDLLGDPSAKINNMYRPSLDKSELTKQELINKIQDEKSTRFSF